MDLLTKNDIKLRINKQDTDHDTVLDQIVDSVSGQIEAYLNRQIESKATTEVFDVADGQEVWLLKAYPVSSITTLRYDVNRQWTASHDVGSEGYTYYPDEGILWIYTGYIAPWPRSLQVVYVGGIATSMTSLQTTATGQVIFEAALQQSAYMFNTRKQIGATGVNMETGAVTWIGTEGLLPNVRRMLDPLRRQCG